MAKTAIMDAPTSTRQHQECVAQGQRLRKGEPGNPRAEGGWREEGNTPLSSLPALAIASEPQIEE